MGGERIETMVDEGRALGTIIMGCGGVLETGCSKIIDSGGGVETEFSKTGVSGGVAEVG